MLVKLIRATPEPVYVAGLAAMVCRNPKDAVGLATEYGIPRAAMENLCKICVKSGHMSVVEHVSYTFLIDGISRACSHQLVRHRLASFTQASQRHVEPGGFVEPPNLSPLQSSVWHRTIRGIVAAHNELLNMCVPMEDARSVLPNATTTTIIMTMNARELAHFLELRLCNKAQAEIRELAQKIHELAVHHFPLLFEHVGPPCFMTGECRESKPCGKLVVLGGDFQKVTQMPENEDEG